MRLTRKRLGVAAIVCLSAYGLTGCQVQTTAQAYPDQSRKDGANWPAVDCIEHVQPEIVSQVAAAMAQLDRVDPNYKGMVCQYAPVVRMANSRWKKGNHVRKGVIAIEPANLQRSPAILAGVLYHESMHGYLWFSGLRKGMTLAEEERTVMQYEANLVESLGDPWEANRLRSLDGNHDGK